LSPDPKPRQPLTATLILEGENVCQEDAYVIGSEPFIEWDKFVTKANSVIINQRTEVDFTSAAGFPCEGTYKIWVNKLDVEGFRTEITHELGVKKEAPPVEPIAIRASTSPDGAPSLPTIDDKHTPPPQPKSKPAVHIVPPTVVVKPPQAPVRTEKNTKNSSFGRWMAILASIALLLTAMITFLSSNKKPLHQAKIATPVVTAEQDAESEPSALSPTDPTPAAETQAPTPEPEPEPTPPETKTAPEPVVAAPEAKKVVAPIVAPPATTKPPETPPASKPVMRSVKIEY